MDSDAEVYMAKCCGHRSREKGGAPRRDAAVHKHNASGCILDVLASFCRVRGTHLVYA